MKNVCLTSETFRSSWYIRVICRVRLSKRAVMLELPGVVPTNLTKEKYNKSYKRNK